jgi:hypothetical protein
MFWSKRTLSLEEFVTAQVCRCCKSHFSMWQKPTICSHCKLVVCSAAFCAKLVAVQHDAPICCRDCWPNVRREIVDLGHSNPQLRDEIDMERAIGDKLFLEHKPGDKVNLIDVLHEAEKEGRIAITQRELGFSSANLLEKK